MFLPSLNNKTQISTPRLLRLASIVSPDLLKDKDYDRMTPEQKLEVLAELRQKTRPEQMVMLLTPDVDPANPNVVPMAPVGLDNSEILTRLRSKFAKTEPDLVNAAVELQYGPRRIAQLGQVKRSYPIRLRGTGQLRSLATNELYAKNRRRGTEVTSEVTSLRVALQDMPKVLTPAITRATQKPDDVAKDTSFKLQLGQELNDLSALNVGDELHLWSQDDLKMRPEVRAWVNPQLERELYHVAVKRAERDEVRAAAEAASYGLESSELNSINEEAVGATEEMKRTPSEVSRDNLARALGQMVGRTVTLPAVKIDAINQETGEITLSFTKPDDLGKNLSQIERYTAEEYGINVRDYVKELPGIVNWLKTEANQAAQAWTRLTQEEGREPMSMEDFLADYQTSVQNLKTQLEPANQVGSSSQARQATPKMIDGNKTPWTAPVQERLNSRAAQSTNRKSLALAEVGGPEWFETLANDKIDTYIKTWGEKLPPFVLNKHIAILEATYGIGEGRVLSRYRTPIVITGPIAQDILTTVNFKPLAENASQEQINGQEQAQNDWAVAEYNTRDLRLQFHKRLAEGQPYDTIKFEGIEEALSEEIKKSMMDFADKDKNLIARAQNEAGLTTIRVFQMTEEDQREFYGNADEGIEGRLQQHEREIFDNDNQQPSRLVARHGNAVDREVAAAAEQDLHIRVETHSVVNIAAPKIEEVLEGRRARMLLPTDPFTLHQSMRSVLPSALKGQAARIEETRRLLGAANVDAAQRIRTESQPAPLQAFIERNKVKVTLADLVKKEDLDLVTPETEKKLEYFLQATGETLDLPGAKELADVVRHYVQSQAPAAAGGKKVAPPYKGVGLQAIDEVFRMISHYPLRRERSGTPALSNPAPWRMLCGLEATNTMASPEESLDWHLRHLNTVLNQPGLNLRAWPRHIEGLVEANRLADLEGVGPKELPAALFAHTLQIMAETNHLRPDAETTPRVFDSLPDEVREALTNDEELTPSETIQIGPRKLETNRVAFILDGEQDSPIRDVDVRKAAAIKATNAFLDKTISAYDGLDKAILKVIPAAGAIAPVGEEEVSPKMQKLVASLGHLIEPQVLTGAGVFDALVELELAQASKDATAILAASAKLDAWKKEIFVALALHGEDIEKLELTGDVTPEGKAALLTWAKDRFASDIKEANAARGIAKNIRKIEQLTEIREKLNHPKFLKIQAEPIRQLHAALRSNELWREFQSDALRNIAAWDATTGEGDMELKPTATLVREITQKLAAAKLGLMRQSSTASMSGADSKDPVQNTINVQADLLLTKISETFTPEKLEQLANMLREDTANKTHNAQTAMANMLHEMDQVVTPDLAQKIGNRAQVANLWITEVKTSLLTSKEVKTALKEHFLLVETAQDLNRWKPLESLHTSQSEERDAQERLAAARNRRVSTPEDALAKNEDINSAKADLERVQSDCYANEAKLARLGLGRMGSESNKTSATPRPKAQLAVEKKTTAKGTSWRVDTTYLGLADALPANRTGEAYRLAKMLVRLKPAGAEPRQAAVEQAILTQVREERAATGEATEAELLVKAGDLSPVMEAISERVVHGYTSTLHQLQEENNISNDNLMGNLALIQTPKFRAMIAEEQGKVMDSIKHTLDYENTNSMKQASGKKAKDLPTITVGVEVPEKNGKLRFQNVLLDAGSEEIVWGKPQEVGAIPPPDMANERSLLRDNTMAQAGASILKERNRLEPVL